MNNRFKNIFVFFILSAISVLLYFLSRSNYLLFHAIVEVYSIIIAAGIFLVSWNARKHSENQNLVFLGSAYVFIGVLDFFHTLSYKGMNIFAGNFYYANQLWICARMIESTSLFLFVVFGFRKIRISFPFVFTAFSVITFSCLYSIYIWKIFPACFIDGIGQTRFKIASEYVICFILFLSLILIIRTKTRYDKNLFLQISWSIIFTIISEFCFTLYTDNYGITNVIGHIFKVLSFYLIYKSIIVNTLQRPFDILFSELNETRAILQAAMDQSSAGIAIAEAPDGKVRYINNAGLIILKDNVDNNTGGTEKEHSTAICEVFDPEGNRLSYNEFPLYRTIKSGEIISGEFIIRNSDGNEHIVLANAAPIKNSNEEITSGIIIFQDITERKQAEEKILTLLNEKKLILKEVHHRIKNNMNTVFGLLTLQSQSQKNPGNRNILSDAASRVESMSILYDKLYRSENESSLPLKEYLPSLVREITGIFYREKPVKIQADIEEIILSAKILSTLGIIINELITNSMKYAFSKNDNAILEISAFQKRNRVSIIFKDNGTGIPESVSFENATGFGMQLVSMLVAQINGTIDTVVNHGTKITIEFDI